MAAMVEDTEVAAMVEDTEMAAMVEDTEVAVICVNIFKAEKKNFF